jgi:hypothetical protein
MFSKVSICFVIWYVITQVSMAYISNTNDLTVSWALVAFSYVLVPLLCGVYLARSFIKAA